MSSPAGIVVAHSSGGSGVVVGVVLWSWSCVVVVVLVVMVVVMVRVMWSLWWLLWWSWGWWWWWSWS